MSEIITVENLSKRYFVGHRTAQPERYITLRDVIEREAHNFTRKTVDLFRGQPVIQGDEVEEFWALRKVNFEVKRGEVVGIIGRNGAGKSTLLKILSRVTEPTEGRVTLRGRVASLLEVGTGFHPELTGRENIFLNGAILGMTQREVRQKFDEIVTFAEVERFLDTPVKHYSSGMYVRLAFAVAAHLEPEILIIDEVLAVGDAEFQKKCLGKIDEISTREGRTILFVTHNTEAVLKLCNRAILLHAGQIQTVGDVKTVLLDYHKRALVPSRIIDLSNIFRIDTFPGRIRFVQIATCDEKSNWCFPFGEDVGFEISVDVRTPPNGVNNVKIAIDLYSVRGFMLASWSSDCTNKKISLTVGLNAFRIMYKKLLLLPGQYYIHIGVSSNGVFEDYIPNAITFDVVPSAKSVQMSAQNYGGAFIPKVDFSKLAPVDVH